MSRNGYKGVQSSHWSDAVLRENPVFSSNKTKYIFQSSTIVAYNFNQFSTTPYTTFVSSVGSPVGMALYYNETVLIYTDINTHKIYTTNVNVSGGTPVILAGSSSGFGDGDGALFFAQSNAFWFFLRKSPVLPLISLALMLNLGYTTVGCIALYGPASQQLQSALMSAAFLPS